MFVITGPGRSGTSLIASIYKELGFDTGGKWIPAVNAGLEDRQVVQLNNDLARDLGISMVGPRSSDGVGPQVRDRSGGVERAATDREPARSSQSVAGIPPENLDEIDARYRNDLMDLAASPRVVKDPRFLYTLPVWAAAGARIDHVLVTLRALDAVIESRFQMNPDNGFTRQGLRRSLLQALGTCVQTVIEFGLSYGIVRFPHFIDDPLTLYENARFPTPTTKQAFLNAFARVADKRLVHHRSPR